MEENKKIRQDNRMNMISVPLILSINEREK